MENMNTNKTSLREIIIEITGQNPSPSKLAKQTNLSKSTLNDALKRPIENTSFGTVRKILIAKNISMDEVSDKIDVSRSPEIEEQKFVSQTDEKKLEIMGIKFSSKENFWNTRESIVNGIYEGFYPSKKNVMDSYKILEEHVPVEKLVNDLLNEYREN
ncbi:winged helix-turn-helix domain-containing protein [Companilactobacillus furfuricola]|uniref:winged helix-turn-helix domain-containing protein n=1 Tax=Companilactobacillus furfuricola TaxID=1462575 RepID=UPI000F7A3920|nr:winged helix-turn-helix domain-containing protein [Companilactobacillus furfuricola]